jgi:hypothetical protein
LDDLTPKSAKLEFAFAQLTALLATKFNWDPISGTAIRRGAGPGFDETAWDRDDDDDDYAPVVVDIESEEDESMDTDVNFAERLKEGGHMDMKTGKMVFERHAGTQK